MALADNLPRVDEVTIKDRPGDRAPLAPAGQKGFTLWITGLSGAGKSTIAEKISELFAQRNLKFEILDGDVIRTNLSKGLGFSKEDRDINIRRIGFVCNILTRNGVIAIAAAISPYANIRKENRELIEHFVEIYAECPLAECERRDVKGLYAKARAGELKGFTGIDDPYEPPDDAEIVCRTDQETTEVSAQHVIDRLIELGYLQK